MAKRNRNTLKSFFNQGKRPSAADFEDLIDSALNIMDDGFSGSLQTGICLTPAEDQERVLSLFGHQSDSLPTWTAAIDKTNKNLKINAVADENKGTTLVEMDYSPENEMQNIHVHGLVRSQGRRGTYRCGSVEADGKWHDILMENYNACKIYEVVAFWNNDEKKRHALLMATAMHCFGRHTRVWKLRSHYRRRGSKICIRWKKQHRDAIPSLQLKTKRNYKQNLIQYEISILH